MTTTLLVVNTNGNSNEINRIKIVKIKTKRDPIEKYMERKTAYESDFVFELSEKQIKNLKKQLQ
jgi:hypothetical protein